MKRSLVILHLFFLCFCDYASSQYEIRCELPKIPHGMVPNLKTEYKENERLSYFCEKNYRPRQGIPVCLRVGWSITPECEEINCLLGPPTPGTSTSPKGKNLFKVGESVEITCSESHWLFGTKQTRQSIICKESGEWEHSPVCEEITCDIPFDQHVDYVHYYFSRDRRLGVKKPYRCERGYQAGARTATCTKDGWLPNPLCTEIRCELPKIPHGMVPNLKTEYKENERLSYFCEKNYRPRQGIPVCLRVGWSITPECEEINCLLGPPTPGTSTSPKGKNLFKVGESVEITCSESHWLFGTKQTKQSIICKESGEWEHSPVCEEITCDIPYDQHVDYVHYYFSRDRRVGVKKPYRCERGYRAGARTATCTKDGWLPNPLCTAKILECDKPPSIAHAVYDFKEQHKDGEKVTYHCPLYYVMEGNPYMTCTQGRWTGSVKCLEPCTVSVPVMDVHHIQLLNGGRQKNYAKHGDHIVFTCQEKHALVEGSVALRQMCNNGVIALPVCQ